MSTSRHRHGSKPQPSDPRGQQLCKIFPYSWQAIIKPNHPDGKWETLTKHAIDPRELWLRWKDPNQIVGVRFGSTTTYGLVDLDAKGIYHPNQDAKALPCLRAALATIGITRIIIIRSSSSDGLHLWVPLPEEVPTFWLAAAIKKCLEVQGFVMRQGWVESFPNCKSFAPAGQFTEYHGHRLPLQPQTGAQLLDDDLNPIAGGLDRFLAMWDLCAANQDFDLLCQAIARAKKNKQKFTHGNAASVDSWRTALEFDICEGWTDHGQTNYLLKRIACYGVVFQGLQTEALIEYVQRTATNCPGYERWCKHQHELRLRCTAWARAAEGYYWPLGTEGSRQGDIHKLEGANAIVPLHRVNEARSQDAQARITAAYEQLKSEGRLPEGKTARENAIVQLAQCSKQTTRKYLHLWYPDRSNLTQEVCTTDEISVSAEFDSVSVEPQKSLELSSGKEVHTNPYMKGERLPFEAGLDFRQLCFSLASDASSFVNTCTKNLISRFRVSASSFAEQLPLDFADISTSATDLQSLPSCPATQAEIFKQGDLVRDG